MALRFKILLCIIYLVLLSLSSLPLASLRHTSLNRSSGSRKVEAIFVSTGLAIASFLAIALGIYAFRLYYNIRKLGSHLNFLSLKLTKFAIAVSLALFLAAFQLIFYIVDIAVKDAFTARYKSANLQALYLTVLFIDWACVLQTYSWDMVVLAFPFMNRLPCWSKQRSKRGKSNGKLSSSSSRFTTRGNSLAVAPLLDEH